MSKWCRFFFLTNDFMLPSYMLWPSFQDCSVVFEMALSGISILCSYSITSVWVSFHVRLSFPVYLFYFTLFLEITYACYTLQHDSTSCRWACVRVCEGVTFLIFYDFRKDCVEVQKLRVTSDSSKRIRIQQLKKIQQFIHSLILPID